ncbi:MAG: serine/threonine-protein phosphatase [Firmicutes bacterium]|nr:serine/threonine-protein phosphatase [Bacillota bacterium]
MKNKIQAAICTNIGNSRENQEDSVVVVCSQKTLLRNSAAKGDPDDRDECLLLPGNSEMLIAVSDGMGGHLGGETASGYTVSCLEQSTRILADEKRDIALSLQEIIGQISQNVADLARKKAECRGMGATVSGLYVKENRFYCFHAGDSRVYRYAGDILTQLTTDHTEGQRLMNLGLLTEEEVQRLPHRKNIYKYVGMDGLLHPDVFEVSKVEPGTLFLLCSDGLTDALSDGDIREVLKKEEPLEAKRERLLREALSRRIGFGDNISFILVEFGGEYI